MEVLVRTRFRTLLMVSACALLLATTDASAQGFGGRFHFGALYDPVFHVSDETSSAGAHFDLSQNVIEKTSTKISWVAEFGFNNFDNDTVLGYLGGGRIAGEINPRMSAFFQFLAGAQHWNGATDFAFQPGLGFDFARWPKITIRTQLDFHREFIDNRRQSEPHIGVDVLNPILSS